MNGGSDGNSHLTKQVLFLEHFLKCNRKINIDHFSGWLNLCKQMTVCVLVPFPPRAPVNRTLHHHHQVVVMSRFAVPDCLSGKFWYQMGQWEMILKYVGQDCCRSVCSRLSYYKGILILGNFCPWVHFWLVPLPLQLQFNHGFSLCILSFKYV